eukprot:1143850-Pelagomonas_calceolata.AAC.3
MQFKMRPQSSRRAVGSCVSTEVHKFGHAGCGVDANLKQQHDGCGRGMHVCLRAIPPLLHGAHLGVAHVQFNHEGTATPQLQQLLACWSSLTRSVSHWTYRASTLPIVCATAVDNHGTTFCYS